MTRSTLNDQVPLDEPQAKRGGNGHGHEPLLTPIRRQILTLLRESSEPIGAYEVLDRLGSLMGRSVSPPTVYRGLSYLQRVGLAVRIESRKGWVACHSPGRDHAVLICVCRACGSVGQTQGSAARAELSVLAEGRGFVARGWTLEVTGRCAGCCSAASAGAT